jgi:hypothetical protein
MLAGEAADRHGTVTRRTERDRVTFACPGRQRSRPVTQRHLNAFENADGPRPVREGRSGGRRGTGQARQAPTAFCTSRASSSVPSSL